MALALQAVRRFGHARRHDHATCTIAQTRLQDVVRPYLRYVAVLLVTLALLIAWPTLTLWLPKHYGLA